MRNWTLLCALGLTSQLTGCAYLTTYKSDSRLGEGAASALVLDMKTRVVTNNHGVVCAEPSPDALSAVAGSASLSGRTGGNAAAGLAESAAFTGLRTQSIQLMRDAMYRLCEGLASEKLSQDDYRSLMRRSQTTMLALLAIEQLTQPVVAGQVLLGTQSAASAGAGAGDAAVTKAEQDLAAATTKRLDQETDLDTALRQRDESAAELKGKRAARAKDKDATLEAEIAALEKQLPEREGVVADKRRRLDRARADEANARDAVAKASSRASTSAAASGALGSPAQAFAQSTKWVAKAVGEIVDEAYDTFADEACLDFMKFMIDPDRRAGAKSANSADAAAAAPAAATGSRVSALVKDGEQDAAAATNNVMKVCSSRFEKKPRSERLVAQRDAPTGSAPAPAGAPVKP